MLYVREMTDEERNQIEQLTHAQAAPVRLAYRAWMIKLSAEGETVSAIAQRMGCGTDVVRGWIHRFDDQGLPGLDDAPRSGRPHLYDEEVRSQVIAKARSAPPKPEGVDIPPTCHWSLNQLQKELNREGPPIKRSQIRRILKAEHIKWQKPRTWLESDDPEFAEKRGPSSSSIPTLPRAAR
jgi:transposase